MHELLKRVLAQESSLGALALYEVEQDTAEDCRIEVTKFVNDETPYLYDNNLKILYLVNRGVTKHNIHQAFYTLKRLEIEEKIFNKSLVDWSYDEYLNVTGELFKKYHRITIVRNYLNTVKNLQEFVKVNSKKIGVSFTYNPIDVNVVMEQVSDTYQLRNVLLSSDELGKVIREEYSPQNYAPLLLIFLGVKKAANSEESELSNLKKVDLDADHATIHIKSEYARDIKIPEKFMRALLVASQQKKAIRPRGLHQDVLDVENTPYVLRAIKSGRIKKSNKVSNSLIYFRIDHIFNENAPMLGHVRTTYGATRLAGKMELIASKVFGPNQDGPKNPSKTILRRMVYEVLVTFGELHQREVDNRTPYAMEKMSRLQKQFKIYYKDMFT